MLRAACFMETHLGHYSYYQNLRRFIDQSKDVAATWIEVTYTDPSSFYNRVPGLPGGVRGMLIGRTQVRAGLSQNNFDISFFNTQVPAVLGGDLVGKKPYIISTDITPIQYDEMGAEYGHRADRFGPLRDFKHRENSRRFCGAARILPWSTWVRGSLIADYQVAPNAIDVIAPGVDIDVWKPGNRADGGPMRALFVGGDFYRKGGSVLLEALDMLPKGVVELAVVTRSDIPQKDGVTIYKNMRPNSPDLIALYQSCDVFVLPSKAEAFGIAAVEASAVGLPVIATAVGGLTDIVTPDETGFLISPDNPYDLADYLRTLAEIPGLRRRFSEAARSKVEDRFNARKNAARFIEILCETVAR